VLEARDSALAALDAIENIATLHSGPLQLQYLSDLLAHLAQAREAGKDVELMAWDYAQSGVAISVAAETLSAAELLSVFESIPWLQAPRVDDDPVRGRMRVTGGLVEGWRFPSGEDATAVETAAVETAAVETAAVETASIEAASVEATQ